MGRQLVRPFGPESFGPETQEQAQALWAWYDASGAFRPGWPAGKTAASSDLPASVTPSSTRPPAGLSGRLILKRVEDALNELGLDSAILQLRQERAEELRAGGGPTSGADLRPFLDDYLGGLAGALSSLRGYRGSWQRRAAAEFAYGLFLIQSLHEAPEWARKGVCLFCRKEMDAAGVTIKDLAGQTVPAGYKRLAWKQSIRARDFLAGARSLIMEMGFRDRMYAKRVWLSALEHVIVLEKADFDVWTSKPGLSSVAAFRVRIQSIFGKTAFQ